MKRQELSVDVRRFLLTSIPSVPYLEAVLLLRAGRASTWTASDVARRLYVPESTALDLLRSLARGGIASQARTVEAFTYRPGTPELSALLDQVAHAYSTNLVAVTDVIHSRTERRAHQFADAFRWRKDS